MIENAPQYVKFLELKKKIEDSQGALNDGLVPRRIPEYQDLLALGEPAIAWMLQEWDKVEAGTHWYGVFLRTLAGDQSPNFPLEAQGKLYLKRTIWLNWGREKGYI